MGLRVSSPSFVGRRAELNRLDEALEQSRSAEPAMIIVAGEAGVGKSRLVEEAAERSRRAGHVVLIGGCLNVSEGAAPLAPLSEALRVLRQTITPQELNELVGAGREALALLLPDIAPSDDRDEGRGLAHDTGQVRVFEHLLSFLSRISERWPLMLVIEDIHWADRSTLDLLTFLSRNLRAVRIALVATYRTDEAHDAAQLRALLAELERAGRVERVELERFGRAELVDQLHGILGAPPERLLVDEVYRLSDGNPFYAEELTAANILAGELPATLGELLLARIGEVNDAGQELLRITSVTGPETTEDLLLSVTEIDLRSLRLTLRDLLDRGLLIRRRDGAAARYLFRHALLQEAVHRGLLDTERSLWHAACAEYLERTAPSSPTVGRLTEIARHWSEAGAVAQALPASIRAGEAAEAAYAPAEASAQYERALRLTEEYPTLAAELGVERASLLEGAARSAATAGSARSIEHILEAISLVDPIADPVRAGLLRERLGRYRWHHADGAGAVKAYREALRLVPATPPTAARARATAGLAQVLLILQVPFEQSIPTAEVAVEAARRVGARDVESHALNTLGTTLAYAGEVERGLTLLRESLDIAREISSPEDVARAFANLLDVLKVTARFAEAADLAPEAFTYSREHGLTATYGVSALAYAAWALYRAGRWSDAAAQLDRARAYPTIGTNEIEVLVFSALVEIARGDFARARSRLDAAQERLAGAIDTQLIAPFAEAHAELALWTGEPGEAVAAVSDGLARIQSPQGANVSRVGPLYVLGVRAAADAVEAAGGHSAAAAEAIRAGGTRCLTQMRRLHRRTARHWPSHLRLTTPYLALAEAEGKRLEGKPQPDAWESAADALSGLGLSYPAAYARWRQAEALLAGRQRTKSAVSALAAARAAAVEMGADPLLHAVESLARRAGLALNGAASAGYVSADQRFGLTPREGEVLELLVIGRTNRQIGDELFISEKTASVHVSNILGKLAVRSRAEAVATALGLGLVEG